MAGQDGMRNDAFELRGVNHLALVCRDMARTVEFYTQVLGMPLTKTLDLPGGHGQHFFFDIGNGDSLAFFWFPDAPEAAPGVASAGAVPGAGNITQRARLHEPHRLRRAARALRGVPPAPHRQGRRGQRDLRPRRQPLAGGEGVSPRRVRALGVLPRPRRHPPRVRLLEPGAAPGGRRDPRPRRRRGKACRHSVRSTPGSRPSEVDPGGLRPRSGAAGGSASVGGR